MRTRAAALAAWLLASGSGAAQSPADAGLPGVAAVLAEAESVAALRIQPPARSLALGLSTKLYQCWRLQLTGKSGLQACETLERLQSAQAAVGELRAALDKGARLHAERPSEESRLRVLRERDSLQALLASFRSLREMGSRNGLVKETEKGLWQSRRTLSPRLKDEDYTMVYDDSSPECPPLDKKK